MHDNYTLKLLDLKDEHLKVTKIDRQNGKYYAHVKYSHGYQICPHCGSITSKIHDYRTKVIKHGVINGEFGYLVYHMRRYVCKCCFKKFNEPHNFVEKYGKVSNLTKRLILKESTKLNNFKTISENLNISFSTVVRYLDKHIKVSRKPLSEVISIDEFKNHTKGDGKYSVCITDPINKKILDILPDRKSKHLVEYFRRIPIEERDNVKYIIIDMWDPYRQIALKYFPKAILIVDKFHFSRHIFWAFNSVRVNIMNKFKTDSDEYHLLKKYWKTLMSPSNKLNTLNTIYDKKLNEKLTGPQIQKRASLIDPRLKDALIIKNFFFNNVNNYTDGLEFITDLRDYLYDSVNPEFKSLVSMFRNWNDGIINSFTVYQDKKLTNGFIEGLNNYIKVIKRISFGYRNFKRFKTRIIHLFNKDSILIG